MQKALIRKMNVIEKNRAVLVPRATSQATADRSKQLLNWPKRKEICQRSKCLRFFRNRVLSQRHIAARSESKESAVANSKLD
jgi:hypothetical protein